MGRPNAPSLQPGKRARLALIRVQDLEVEQKRTKCKINGTATTAIEKSNPNLPAKSRLPYSYQEHEQAGGTASPRLACSPASELAEDYIFGDCLTEPTEAPGRQPGRQAP